MKFPIHPSPKHWLVLGWLCMILLAACGQKGPLYLPEGATAKGPESTQAKEDAEAKPEGDEDESR